MNQQSPGGTNVNGPNSFDAVEHLFLGYAKTVKTFSSRRQIEVKMRMAQLIMEEEILHLQESGLGSLITGKCIGYLLFLILYCC